MTSTRLLEGGTDKRLTESGDSYVLEDHVPASGGGGTVITREQWTVSDIGSSGGAARDLVFGAIPTNDDLILLWCGDPYTGATHAATPPSGFTPLAVNDMGSGFQYQAIWGKRASSEASATYRITFNADPGFNLVCFGVVFRGVDTATALDAPAAPVTNVSWGASNTAASITTATAGAAHLIITGYNTSATYETVAGYTLTPAPSNSRAAMWWGLVASPGPTGSKTLVTDVSGWGNIGIALKAASTAFNPLTSIPWSAAFWAEDPAVTPPANGATLPASWNQPGSYTAVEWSRVGSPKWISSWKNGHPAVDFLQGDRLTTAFAGTSQPITTVAIVAETTTAESDLIDGIDAITGGAGRTVFDRTTGVWRAYQGNNLATPSSDSLPHLFIVRFANDAGGAVNVDGTTLVSGSTGTLFGRDIALGSTNNNAAHVESKIAFVGVTSGELTTQQRTDLLTWYQATYVSASTTPVSATRATTWNVASPTTQVSASRATTWNVAAAGPTATLVASLLNPAGDPTSKDSLTSASFTPPANAKLYYLWGQGRNGQTDAYAASKITDSVGSTITELCASTPTHPFGAGYGTSWGASVSDTGATPAARTVIFDPWSTASTGWMYCFVVAVVGGTAVRSEAYGTNSTSATLTLTASSAPGAGNLSMYMFGVDPDQPFVAQPAIPGWTALANPVPTAYVAGAVFTKQGNTTAALTQTGLGTGISVTGGVILEVAPTAAVTFADDFNRADGPLTAPWVAEEGSHSIVGSKLVETTTNLDVSYYNQTFPADQWAEGDVSWVNGGSHFVPCVRITGVGGDFYYFWNSGSNAQINKRVGGTYTSIGAVGSAIPLAFKARLEAQGTTIRAYADGVLVATATDSAIAAGKAGVLSASGSGATFDNFRAGAVPYTPSTTPVSASRSTTWNVASSTTTVTATRATTWNVASPTTPGALDFTFTQTDGPANGWTATGGQVLEVVNNQAQTTNASAYQAYAYLTGLDFSAGDFQVDADILAPVIIGDGSIGFMLLDAANNGYQGLWANSTHIYEVNAGVRTGYLTNDARTIVQCHATFQYRKSDGLLRCYVNGSVNSTTNVSTGYANFAALVVFMQAAAFPAFTAWLDNIHVQNFLSAPPTLTPVAPATRATTWNVAAPTTAVTATRATTWSALTPLTVTRPTTWATRTAVTSATRATTWTTKAAITASRATLWTVTTAVTAATRATTWNALAPLTATRDTSWSTRTTVTAATRSTTWVTCASVTAATRATTWAVAAGVVATRATTWNVAGALTAVTASRTTTWSTQSTVSATRPTTWSARTTVTAATRSTVWAVGTTVTASRPTTWAVTVPVSAASRATTWNTSQALLVTRPTTWTVRTPVTVNRATTWSTTSLVTATRATTWNIAAIVAPTRATTWSVLSPVTAATRSTTWGARALITSSRATTWNVAGILAFVQATRTTTWGTRAQITGLRPTTWTTQTQVTPASRVTIWTTLTSVAPASRSTTWRTAEQIIGLRSTTWKVTQFVSAQRSTTWNTVVVVQALRSTTWSTKALITAQRSTTFDVLVLVVTTRVTLWAIQTRCSASRSTTWGVRQRITAPRSTFWRVASATPTLPYLTLYPNTVMYVGDHRVHAIYQGTTKVWSGV